MWFAFCLAARFATSHFWVNIVHADYQGDISCAVQVDFCLPLKWPCKVVEEIIETHCHTF
jgi:hypothetical protein